ncbi:MAG: flagellar motor protein MotB [Deltaproteobacteria bacterium]|jgi:chemotaxis protein MotB|nr:flagellar motor protein MotB [Deltaproteobacteria bacterium]
MSGSWKVAYADFVTAMMAFFLLMWLLAQVPEEKLVALGEYFKTGGRSTGSGYGLMVNDDVPPPSLDATPLSPEQEISIEVSRFLTDLLRERDLQEKVRVTPIEDGVLLRVQSGVMFDENDVALGGDGVELLHAAATTARQFKLDLQVRGHADSMEGSGEFGPWELSALRSAVTVRYLVEAERISPSLLSCVFYGATQPIVPDRGGIASPENRRVEFFFHRPAMSLNSREG